MPIKVKELLEEAALLCQNLIQIIDVFPMFDSTALGLWRWVIQDVMNFHECWYTRRSNLSSLWSHTDRRSTIHEMSQTKCATPPPSLCLSLSFYVSVSFSVSVSLSVSLSLSLSLSLSVSLSLFLSLFVHWAYKPQLPISLSLSLCLQTCVASRCWPTWASCSPATTVSECGVSETGSW